jgi:hypothetical protein
MTFTEQEVEWIVVEVLRRLGLAARSQGPVATTPELTLTDKVIAMRTIDGRLNGVKRLQVPAKAVVTPAVRDELIRLSIELVRH